MSIRLLTSTNTRLSFLLNEDSVVIGLILFKKLSFEVAGCVSIGIMKY